METFSLYNNNSKGFVNSSILISGSKFLAINPGVTNCVAIHFSHGSVLIERTIISNQYGHGLYMELDYANATLTDISVFNTSGGGIEILTVQHSTISLTDVTTYNNSNSLEHCMIYLGCTHTDNKLYLTNISASSSSMPLNDTGIKIWCPFCRSIVISHVIIYDLNSSGLNVVCVNGCNMNLTDIFIRNVTGENGIGVYTGTSSYVNIINVKVRECFYGIYTELGSTTTLNLFGISLANNLYHGLFCFCRLERNEVNMVDLISVGNLGSGVVVFSSVTDIFNLTQMVLAHNMQSGLSVKCGPATGITLTNLTVLNNSLSGIATHLACQISFQGHPSTIANNRSPSNGGGMWISGSTIILSDSTPTYFINNTAQGVGGAMYIANIAYSVDYFRQCTMYVRFSPVFNNNNALVAGNDIYNGVYWKCAYADFTNHGRILSVKPGIEFLERVSCSTNPLFSHFKAPISNYVTSTPLGVCLCVNESINCSIRSIESPVYPGQHISLSLVTVGVCGGISPSVLVTSGASDQVRIVHMENDQETERKCKNFTYKIETASKSKGKGQIQIIRTAANLNLKNSHLNLNFSFLQCPIGLCIISGSCQCGSVIGAINGTHCDVNNMPHPISRPGNNWLYYSEEYQCLVAQSNCPFDYCDASTVHLSLNESDLQCTNGRSGILCGGCQDGLSLMLGSNKCRSCNDEYVLLVGIFILAGIILVVFLLTCNLTVSIGSINGLLFYANIVKLNEPALFPNGASIPVLSQFIAWLNLDLGIQTCFFNGLDGYWKTWLQFAFPLYIWLLIGCIITGCYYSGRLSRLCGNNSVPVLATLILLSFTKLLRTITNILMVSKIKCEDRLWYVWSLDGNIGYLSHKHIPLFLVAVLFLLIGLLYTGLVLSAQWLQRYSDKCCRKSSHDPVVKLKPFIDAYTGPYKDKYRYWTGALLMTRLLLTTLFSYTTGTAPKINNYTIALASFVILYLSKDAHRKKIINFLSSFYYFNLGLLALCNAISDNMGLSADIKIIFTVLSVSATLICFLVTVGGHIFIIARAKCKRRCKRRSNEDGTFNEAEPLLLQNPCSSDEENSYSPAAIIMRRESLIFDLNIYY